MPLTTVNVDPALAPGIAEEAVRRILEEDAQAAVEAALPFGEWVKYQWDEDLWGDEDAFADAVLTYPLVAWKACHGVGKSYTVSRIILRWLQSDPRAIVLLTGSKFKTVQQTIFGEVKSAARAALHASFPEPLADILRITDQNYCQVFTVDDDAAIQGYHAGKGKILIVVDEAQVARDGLLVALRGIQAGGQVHIVLTGNPTNTGGPFHAAFSPGSRWKTFTTDAFATPNLAGITPEMLLEMDDTALDANPVPWLIDRRWVRDALVDWGEQSPLFQARVRGQFPADIEDALFNLRFLDFASFNHVPISDTEALYAGIDPAGPGKAETILYLREGIGLLPGMPLVIPKNPADDNNFAAIELALHPYLDRLENVTVDASGLGFGLAPYLRLFGYRVTMFRGEAPARRPDVYLNRRAEGYFGLEAHFRSSQVGNLRDPKTIAQLQLLKSEMKRGVLAIESKASMKTRGIASPDRADGLMYCYATGEDLARVIAGPVATVTSAGKPSYLTRGRARTLEVLPLFSSLYRNRLN